MNLNPNHFWKCTEGNTPDGLNAEETVDQHESGPEKDCFRLQ